MPNPSQATSWDKQKRVLTIQDGADTEDGLVGYQEQNEVAEEHNRAITGPKLTIGTAAFNGPALFVRRRQGRPSKSVVHVVQVQMRTTGLR